MRWSPLFPFVKENTDRKKAVSISFPTTEGEMRQEIFRLVIALGNMSQSKCWWKVVDVGGVEANMADCGWC